jgi:nucleoside-diphosphate-sugar epimerase
MKVFLAGATGAIGRFAVPALVAAGHDVTALARSSAKAAQLAEAGATPASVDLFDRPALAEALSGHDAVVNIATHIPPTTRAARASAWAENDRIRREGSATVADAAIAAGVGRYVQESITFTYPDRGEAWIDEGVPLDAPPALASTAAAEASVARFTATGGTGVVLRFAALYGPGSEQTDQMLALARRHVGVQTGRPGGYVSSLHLADAGTAVAAALTVPAGTYNAADDEPVRKRALADALADAVSVRPWVRVPGRLAPLVFRGPTAGILRSHRVANAKLRAAGGGWAPRYPSAREGMRSLTAPTADGSEGGPA